MSTSESQNRQYLIRLWIPAILFGGFVGFLIINALLSGDVSRSVPVAVGLVIAAIVIVLSRWNQKQRFARLLRSPDPTAFRAKASAAARRIPHGSQLAAANCATILALYGRSDDAEQALDAVLWREIPPYVAAQASTARAVIAYTRGAITEGLDHAAAAAEQSELPDTAPGAAIAQLAFRNYRNLGLALAGRATVMTRDELREAHAQLPPLGKILAAWGLATVARRDGDKTEFDSMVDFIRANAPHLTPIFASLA